jgi:hypothetical protein
MAQAGFQFSVPVLGLQACTTIPSSDKCHSMEVKHLTVLIELRVGVLNFKST